MRLFFCPNCRQPFPSIQTCPECGISTTALANTYEEELLETVLSKETSRAGMAVDVLTKWLHEPRAIVPLMMLLERKSDLYSQVLGARGLGWLRAVSAIPALTKHLLDESQPYVSRVAAAEALGRIGGKESLRALKQARRSPHISVAEISAQALKKLRDEEQEIQS
jgi:HEAT repeat protein